MIPGLGRAILKENAIKIAEFHKTNCKDPDCGISLTMFAELLAIAGYILTPEEWKRIL